MRFAGRPGLRPLAACFVLLCLAPRLTFAQAAPAADSSYFKYQKIMVPMRDGVKLETVILTPRNQQGPLPILLTRTPYGVPQEDESRDIALTLAAWQRTGTIKRCCRTSADASSSEGEFEMMRPTASHSATPKAIDEVTDAWDTVDWLVKNLPNNNGRVGIYWDFVSRLAGGGGSAQPASGTKSGD